MLYLTQLWSGDILNKNKCRGQEDPATWAVGIGNSWRTTGDIQDDWKRFLFFVAFFFLCNLIETRT